MWVGKSRNLIIEAQFRQIIMKKLKFNLDAMLRDVLKYKYLYIRQIFKITVKSRPLFEVLSIV